MGIKHFRRYRDVVQQKINENAQVRGYKSRIAQELSIQKSYFSQVLKGTADLTQDHASILCDFWQLDKDDSEYFITLVNLERADTPSLKSRLSDRLKELSQKLSTSLETEKPSASMDFQNTFEYYSQWRMIIIYCALQIPELRNAGSIASRIGVSAQGVMQALVRLESIGLVQKKGEEWEPVGHGVSAPVRSLQALFHSEIRKKSNEAYTSGDSDGIYLSLVRSMSRAQYLEIRQTLREKFKEVESATSPTNDEEIVVFGLDFFRIGRS